MLKAAGRPRDAENFEAKMRARQAAKNEILPLYREANAVKTLGVAPIPISITAWPTCARPWADPTRPSPGIVSCFATSATTQRAGARSKGSRQPWTPEWHHVRERTAHRFNATQVSIHPLRG